MTIHSVGRFMRSLKLSKTLMLGIAVVGAGALAWATPPEPGAKIILDDRAILTTGGTVAGRAIAGRTTVAAQRAVLPVRLQLREAVSSLMLTIKARPVVDGRPEFAQTELITVQEQKLEGESLRKVAQEPINISLVTLKPGQYNLEISLQGRTEDGGFSDKQVRRIIVAEGGRFSLLNLGDVVQARVATQQKAFDEQRRKSPKDPDIRLLMDDAVNAPIAQGKIGKLDIADAQKLQVRAGGPSERFKGFYNEREDQSWSSTDPITVKGRLWFQDIDGAWKPLVNAAVHLWDDDTFGDDHLASVSTDWDGRWSFTVNNDDGFLQDGRDIYYTFKLANTRFNVNKCGGDYEWKSNVRDDLNDGTVVDFGDQTASTDMDALRVFSTINLAWAHADGVGGQDPGMVETCFPGSGTFYNGKVNVAAGDVDGPDSITHEYGHALMKNANGSDPSPGGSHGFGDCNQNQALSWSEGWATGFMLSVRPDGAYNWHEGDGGRNIENFSSSCQLGETSEGRVAGALLDFMDSANDNNGGNTNRGRNGVSDNNSGARISLASIFRDTLWGSSPHNNFLNFWTSLSGEVNATQRSGGADIMFYNWMSVVDPNACVATKVSTSRLENPEPVLTNLRAFRDLSLKKYPQGRQLINSYYRNSPEMAKILLDNPSALEDAFTVVNYFAELGGTLGNNARFKKLMAEDAALIPDNVQKAADNLLGLFEKNGGGTLREDVAGLRPVYDRYRKLSVSAFQQTISEEKAKADPKEATLIRTGQFSDESQRALKDSRIQSVLMKGITVRK
jgi:hypothetical protein